MAVTNDGSSNLDALVALLQSQQSAGGVQGGSSTGVTPVASPNVVPVGAPQVDAGSLGGISPDSFKGASSAVAPQLVLNPGELGGSAAPAGIHVLPTASSSSLWGGPSNSALADASALSAQRSTAAVPGPLRIVVPQGVDPAALIQALNGASSPASPAAVPLSSSAAQPVDTAALMQALGASQPSSPALSSTLSNALAAQGKQG